jgi:CRP-like cAMP-binding protein
VEERGSGDKVLTEGQPVSTICIAISGIVHVRQRDKDVADIEPGLIIGTALALTGDPSPVDAAFTGAARYMCWPLHNLRSFLDKRPELRVTLQGLVNRDLSRKLDALLTK